MISRVDGQQIVSPSAAPRHESAATLDAQAATPGRDREALRADLLRHILKQESLRRGIPLTQLQGQTSTEGSACCQIEADA